MSGGVPQTLIIWWKLVKWCEMCFCNFRSTVYQRRKVGLDNAEICWVLKSFRHTSTLNGLLFHGNARTAMGGADVVWPCDHCHVELQLSPTFKETLNIFYLSLSSRIFWMISRTELTIMLCWPRFGLEIMWEINMTDWHTHYTWLSICLQLCFSLHVWTVFTTFYCIGHLAQCPSEIHTAGGAEQWMVAFCASWWEPCEELHVIFEQFPPQQEFL